MSENQYTSWVGVYPVIAKQLVARHRKSSNELLNALRGIGMGIPEQNREAVDPFTILEWVRADQKEENTDERINRINKIWRILGESPKILFDDRFFDGFRLYRPGKRTQFPQFVTADIVEIENLWELASRVVDGGSWGDMELFVKCLKITHVGAVGLTCGLYLTDPKNFIPIDAITARFFKNEENIVSVSDFMRGGTVTARGSEKQFAKWYDNFLKEDLPRFKEKYGVFAHGLVQKAYDSTPQSVMMELAEADVNESENESSEVANRGDGTNETKKNASPEDNDTYEKKVRSEGERIEKRSFEYRRDPQARKECLAEFGYACKVCGFDFEKEYGELGKEYIEVHHLIPLSEGEGEKRPVEPKKDLIPVCPNCHAMLHRRTLVTPDDLREKMKECKK